ncbi:MULTISPECIES: PadR family transcriptional regulator [Arthrobacter]|uniref:PadR family transcriptional regulator n=1 Tax=Arthrobacter psychrochitiniphilus TaxID=291045 RepID=A0A2V3DP47_9MICC|nr:PadR family transcriptional regulator [Arthrobacter psychrochitiniphilus]NYG17022.1 PadR family transcriptional regulator PadR [Arthrobacter psychrochitiniphilus]PXA64762.1 PadR family transcriptional regulator [Arthrobacter psychrochitiniphilus]
MDYVTSPHDPQLLRGVLPMLILSLLHQQESYGYDLVERLRAVGLSGLATGAVYPVLSRFERDGWLSSYLQPSTSGPARKYYALTNSGEQARMGAVRKWREIVEVANRGLATAGTHPGPESERNMA